MDEPTLGELQRQFERMERRVDSQFARLDKSLENMQFVHRDVYATNQNALWKAIDDVKGRLTWITRTVAGALITAGVAAFMTIIAVRGGP